MGLVKEMLLSDKRSRIEEWIRSRAMATPMPNGDTLCRVLGEHPMVVTLKDHSIAPHLVMHGYWEMWVTICLAKRIMPTWNCIDVGANFGYYTLLLADLAHQGRVEAWEPQQSLYRRLDLTLRLSGFAPRVHVMNGGAGAKQEMRALTHEFNDYGGASLVLPDPGEGEGDITVWPLSKTILPRVDFVKIDAEGMEPEVWEGLGDIRPQAAVIEWSPLKYEDPAGFLSTLKSQGYSVGRIDQHGNVVAVSEGAERELIEIKGWEALWLERQA